MTLSKSVLGTVAALSLTVTAAFATVPAQTSSCSYQFNTNLRMGAVSTDVQNLQKLLNMDAATKVASTGAGSMGYETLRFGPATLAAVKKFQAANGISPVSGYVGPLTRAVLNTICSSSAPSTNTGGNTSTGSGVSSNSIPVSVLVSGQASAKLGEFVVTGNGMVTGITLQRTGLSNNGTLKNVYLYDGMTRLTDGSSVRTDGSISFSASSGLFPVNGSKTITVKADICNSTSPCPTGGTSGQTVGVALTGVTMMGGTTTPVTGVAGPLFSISSANTASANFSQTPTPSFATYSSSAAGLAINAGSMNQTLWSNSVSIGTNPVNLWGATFKMIGSAPQNTLANVQLYVDGVSAGSASINMNNQYVFAMTAPVRLNTGAHTIELRGDIVAGANRSFYVTVERGSDIMVEDTTLPGIFVNVTQSSADLINSNAGYISVNTGTLNISQDPSFNNTTTLVSGASQATLAKYKFTAYGEDVKVTSLTFNATTFTLAGGANADQTTLANVGLYVNGSQVGSNQTLSTSTTPDVSFTGLGSNLYVPAGQSVTVEVRGDVMDQTSDVYTSGSLQLTMLAGSSNVQGISSSNVTSSQSAPGQLLTIGNNVTFSNTTGFSTATKAPNTQGVKVGSFTVQTGSAEGITVNQLGVVIGGTMAVAGTNQLTNLTVKDGNNVVGTPIGSPVIGTNNFSINASIPANTTKVYDVYGDFGSSSNGLTVIASSTMTYRGNTSNQTNTAVVGSAVTTFAGAATIVPAGVTYNSGLSPVAQAVVGGQSAFNIGTFNFKVSNSVGGAVINDITFAVATNTINSITINGKTASVVNGKAVIYSSGIVVPADAGGINVPVTVSTVCVGLSNGCNATSSSAVQIGIAGLTFNNGTTIDTSMAPGAVSPIAATSTSFTLYNSKPTLTVNSSTNTGLNLGAENKIGEVTIAADANGQIKVNTITFNISTSGVTSASTTAARLADGNTTISGSSCLFPGNTAIVCTLGTTPNGYTIAAGQSKTFSLYSTNSGTATPSVSVTSISTSVSAAGLMWDDVVGGGTNLTGSNIYNFPTNSYTIRQ